MQKKRASLLAGLTCLAIAVAIASLIGASPVFALVREDSGFNYSPGAPATGKDLGSVAGPITVYGRLRNPSEVDVYLFTAQKDASSFITVSVPVWPSTGSYRPAAIFLPASALSGRTMGELPALIGQYADILDPGLPNRQRFYDALSGSNYYSGGSSQVTLKRGKSYAIVIFNADGQAGPYRLDISERVPTTSEGLSHPLRLLRLKFGAYGGAGPDAALIFICLGWALVLAAAFFAVYKLLERRRNASS
jgi:hypothetical protein